MNPGARLPSKPLTYSIFFRFFNRRARVSAIAAATRTAATTPGLPPRRYEQHRVPPCTPPAFSTAPSRAVLVSRIFHKRNTRAKINSQTASGFLPTEDFPESFFSQLSSATVTLCLLFTRKLTYIHLLPPPPPPHSPIPNLPSNPYAATSRTAGVFGEAAGSTTARLMTSPWRTRRGCPGSEPMTRTQCLGICPYKAIRIT